MASSPSRLFAEISTAERPGSTRVLMRRAVVLGASMAGLLAARVLSDHAEEVLIIERDASEADNEPRPGVPQGTQVHGLLPAGNLQLDRWFPGFTAEAIEAGGTLPTPESARIYLNDVLRPPAPPVAGIGALVSTRPFLETLVRRRTLAVENISLVTGQVKGIDLSSTKVTGVRYTPTGADEPVTEAADMVVDGMGRSSKLSDWLEDAGWPAPELKRMPIKLNYATALFRRDTDISDSMVVVAQTTAGKGRVARMGGINAVEDDRWIMLIAGYGDDRPTRDFDDFKARCRRDFPSVFGDIAERAERLGEVITYHQADSRRREFHKLSRLPGGLVAAGDAVASFNPVYGQGMTSAMLHASCLSAHLRSGASPAEPAHGYFERVKVVVDAAWQISTQADLELPHVDGPYPKGYRVTSWLGDLVFAASMKDQELNARLSAVTMMLAHPMSLARPSTLLRAVKAKLSR
ncbi:FAD-dependent oxidoreductase [Allokutzneria multivorans]|uniref:FAD-dependent oxidoreductase n=1 Tax=Allokutzneria multivorans TaxID=1142134 RepID=A0ABP7SIN5_9PSEU